MSAFTKPPHDAAGGSPKPEAQASKPPAVPKPGGPSVVVTRTIDVGTPPMQRTRLGMPTVPVAPHIPGGGAPKAPPPPARNATTVKMEPPPKSVRPSAPPMEAETAVHSIADTFERLLALDLDEGFAAIERKQGQPPTIEGMEVTDLAEVRALFAQLAAGHVRPVRDFLMDLRWGEATVEWIDLCQPALKSLRRAADKLELPELCEALDAFAAALDQCRAAGSRTIEGERRSTLLATHERLAAVMPQAFALDLDRSARESTILRSLLLQVPGVKKVTIDKLYGAGLTTLEAMLLANPGDVAATTGIDLPLAERIVARFKEHHAQVQAGVPDATRTRERDRIAELTMRLQSEHRGYEEASRGWSKEAGERKRQLREARARTLLDIQVLLARLGEVERLKEIERLPFERKLAHLEAFLDEAQDKYAAAP